MTSATRKECGVFGIMADGSWWRLYDDPISEEDAAAEVELLNKAAADGFYHNDGRHYEMHEFEWASDKPVRVASASCASYKGPLPTNGT